MPRGYRTNTIEHYIQLRWIHWEPVGKLDRTLLIDCTPRLTYWSSYWVLEAFYSSFKTSFKSEPIYYWVITSRCTAAPTLSKVCEPIWRWSVYSKHASSCTYSWMYWRLQTNTRVLVVCFERYNGILGREPNNNHSPEVQIICATSLEKSSLYRIQPSAEFQQQFSGVYPLLNVSDVQSSCSQTISTTHWAQITSTDLTIVEWSIDLTYFKLTTNSRWYILSSDEQRYLKQMYTRLYPQLRESDFSIPSSIRKYSTVTGPLFRYDSSGKGSSVLANWADQAHINTNDIPRKCTILFHT